MLSDNGMLLKFKQVWEGLSPLTPPPNVTSLLSVMPPCLHIFKFFLAIEVYDICSSDRCILSVIPSIDASATFTRTKQFHALLSRLFLLLQEQVSIPPDITTLYCKFICSSNIYDVATASRATSSIYTTNYTY